MSLKLVSIQMELFFRKVGEGKPLIILHGVFGSSDNWFSISKILAEKGYEVYAIDARNHGQSPRSEEFSYDLMANDLHEFIESHQIKAPIIIGHSMGGKVVMNFAMRFPNTYSKLIIVDITPKFYPTHHEHIIKGLNAIDLTSLNSRNEAEGIAIQYIPNFSERQFLLKNLYRTEDNSFDWRINLPVLSREIYQIGGEIEVLREIEEPTLFMRGSESGYVLDEDIDSIKTFFMTANFKTIEGAGHWIQAEKPNEFVNAVVEFDENS
jgi:esterase